MDILQQLAEELKLRKEQVTQAVALLDDGKTVPFIARYRKEQTGSLDDQTLHTLSERLNYLRRLEERKQEILDAICWSPPWAPPKNRCIFSPVASETIFPVVPVAQRE